MAEKANHDPDKDARDAVEKARKARLKELRDSDAYREVVRDPRNAEVDPAKLDKEAIEYAIAVEKKKKDEQQAKEEKEKQIAYTKKRVKIGAVAVAGALVLFSGLRACTDDNDKQEDTVTGVNGNEIDKSQVTAPENDAICHDAEGQVSNVIDEAKVTEDSRKRENLTNTASLMLDFDVENGCLTPEEEQRIEDEINRLLGE
ncbi:hypothetical protein DYH10_01140 [Candidatus Saccharibacteria bacterium CPR2]|nr:hypothetical protein [Candidatus Saccharibacteria bacterium CPR2]